MRRAGFSLIELTVAAALLGLGLALTLGAAARCLHATRVAHAQERAVRAAGAVADSLAAAAAPANGVDTVAGTALRWTVASGPAGARWIRVAAHPAPAPEDSIVVETLARVALP